MKYIIEIEEKPLCVFDKDTQTYFPRLWRVKGFNSLVFDEEGLSRLEELNSDYINEHYGDLQDDAYNKGYAQCQDDYSDALKHAKDTAYKKGLHDGESKCGYCNEYQRGLEDGKAVYEKGCEGCKFEGNPNDNPCKCCMNGYPNQWTAKDDKIVVGDEVKPSYSDITGVVTLIDDDTIYVLWRDGSSTSVIKLKEVTKTGRHFDIASILKEMQS